MKISSEELRMGGFRRAGTVCPDAAKKVRVQIDWDVPGFVVYIMVVDHEFKKAGTTGRKNSSFKTRMNSTFSALRQRMVVGGLHLEIRSNVMRHQPSWRIGRSSYGRSNSQ